MKPISFRAAITLLAIGITLIAWNWPWYQRAGLLIVGLVFLAVISQGAEREP